MSNLTFLDCATCVNCCCLTLTLQRQFSKHVSDKVPRANRPHGTSGDIIFLPKSGLFNWICFWHLDSHCPPPPPPLLEMKNCIRYDFMWSNTYCFIWTQFQSIAGTNLNNVIESLRTNYDSIVSHGYTHVDFVSDWEGIHIARLIGIASRPDSCCWAERQQWLGGSLCASIEDSRELKQLIAIYSNFTYMCIIQSILN